MLMNCSIRSMHNGGEYILQMKFSEVVMYLSQMLDVTEVCAAHDSLLQA